MEANELRIGNKVLVFFKKDNYFYKEDTWDEITIEGINKYEISFAMPDIATFNFIHYISELKEFTKGIPLTEEWLVKFGFKKKQKTVKFKDGKSVWKTWSIDIESIPNTKFGLRYINGYWVYPNANIFRTIKYVHQLQNLYFALTREELTLQK